MMSQWQEHDDPGSNEDKSKHRKPETCFMGAMKGIRVCFKCLMKFEKAINKKYYCVDRLILVYVSDSKE